MRPKTLILFVVAIGCGLVASIGVSQYMERAGQGTAIQIETQKIYVAAVEVNIGEKLDEKNLKLEEWPKDRVPEGAITELKQLENMYPRTRFYKGEPILMVKLSDKIDGNKAQTIPAGFRVVATKVSAETGGGGLIRPGDRVDVVVFLRKSAEVPESGTKTILRDVNVFAVDAETERAIDKGTGQAREVRTISLLVKPKQAEALMLAKEFGTMSLTLRRPNDGNEDSTEGSSIKDLLGDDTGEVVNEKKTAAKDDGGFAKWLANAANQTATPRPEVAAPTPPVQDDVKFKMKIRTPTGDRTFVWHDLNGEPVEEGGETPVSMTAPPAPAMAAPAAQPIAFPVSTPAPATGPAEDNTSNQTTTSGNNSDEPGQPATSAPGNPGK